MKERTVTAGIGELSRFASEALQLMGKTSLQFYGKCRPQLAFDQDLVTQAELHLNDAFQKHLEKHFPNHLIFGAESMDEAYTHGDQRYLWVFDPLDGVDNFQTGIPVWGMSLALYENHWPVLGMFYMPVTGDLFRANAGETAYWNDRPVTVSDRGDLSQEGLILTYSRFNQSYRCRFPGKIRALGSTGAHVCYVAMGRADAAIVANEGFKDLAAVRVIVESAGGRLYNLKGEPFFVGDYADGRRIDEHLMITSAANAAIIQDSIGRI